MRLKTWHIYVFPQVQQNRLSVSKCRNYAQPTSECQGFFQGSVLQVTPQSQFLTAPCPVSTLLYNSVLPLQECHPHVCNSRGSPNSRGSSQLRWSAGSFCHQSLRPFSPGTSHTQRSITTKQLPANCFTTSSRKPNFLSCADLYCDPIPITRVSQF